MMEMTENTMGDLSLINLFPDWSYLLDAPFTSSQGITAFFMVIIALVLLSALIGFFYHWSRAKVRISFLVDTLSDINSDELIQKREHINEVMKEPLAKVFKPAELSF